MIGALFYLLWNSWRNRLVMRFKRLKQPKYLVGAIVGVLYFGLNFARFFFSGRSVRPSMPGVPSEATWLLELIAPLILFVIVLLAWLVPHERAALVFSEAEVAFLFPAPVSRRTLIHFKLIKSQIAILFTILIFTLIFRFNTGGAAWMRALGWWVVFSSLNLHFMGSSFARTMLLDRGISNWKRRGIVIALVAVMAGGVVAWILKTMPKPETGSLVSLADVMRYAEEALKSGPLPYLLYPFRIVVGPYFATHGLPFLNALWPALLLLGLHYVWVVRSDVAFEEASIEASQKVAERVAAIRSGKGQMGLKPKKKKRPPFELNPVGMPSMALLWKNLINAGYAFTPRFWLMVAIIGGIVAWSLRRTITGQEIVPLLGTLMPMGIFWSLLLGPQIFRQDFRSDLPMADVLKTFPLKGWQMALGELLAPAMILTLVHWMLLFLGVIMLHQFGSNVIPLEARLSVAFSAAIVLPALNLVTMTIPNAAVLLFPGWFQTGKEGPQGIEATGQRLFLALGQFFVFIVALVPAAIVFALVFFLGNLVVNYLIAIPLAAIAATVVVGVEAWLGLLWVGRLFEKFDLSSETAG